VTEANIELILYRLGEMDKKIDDLQANLRTGLVNDATTTLRLNTIETDSKKAGRNAGLISSGVISGLAAAATLLYERFKGN
jgi:hypothetical protein